MNDWLSWQYLRVAKKSAAAGLRTTKQSESQRDHLNHWPGQHSLRFSGGGWTLRLRLQRSVPGRELGMALEAKEQCTMVEGTQEKVWTYRRGKVPCWGGERRRGAPP